MEQQTPDPVTARQPVTILMAVHRGGEHLREQLQSFAAQKGAVWNLVISDDAGDARDAEIIQDFATSQGREICHNIGPKRGFAANFLQLIADCQGLPGPVALADQDDVWLPGKLSRAMTQLNRIPPGTPALYCSSRWIWTPDRGTCRPARRCTRMPGFANALVENVAPGNTIVLNAAAVALVAPAARICGPVFAHDWWLYQLLSGAGARIIVDPEPTLLYRQHANNALGAGEGLRALARNKLGVLRGRYADRLNQQIAALNRCAPLLTPENRAVLARFERARLASLTERLSLLSNSGVYRQSTMSSLGFWGAALLGRI